MQKEMYKLDNNVERLERGCYSLFLDGRGFKNIKHKLKNVKYNIYSLYDEADKIILYKNVKPVIVLYKIESIEELRHQDIMGTLYNLGINTSYIGDIVKYNNNFYMFVLNEVKEYIKENFNKVGNNYIKLNEVSLELLKDYKREYEHITIIENSLRLDAVIATLSKLSRSQALDKFKNKEITLNYDITLNNTYNLKENDIFSIRRVGKFIFRKVSKTTSKNKYIIEIDKYK